MKIAIVNDVSLALETLRRGVLSMPGGEIAWEAVNGREAVEKCAAQVPDLILMDLLMPVLNGVEATREIMARTPCPILVVTFSVEENYRMVFEAMGYGALDAVSTPRLGEYADLHRKMELVGRFSAPAQPPPRQTLVLPPRTEAASSRLPPLLAIGASTGGPKAVAAVLGALPAGLPAAVVVIQHMGRLFADALAKWLDQHTPLPVAAAEEGAALRPGEVRIAATDDHLVLGVRRTLHYTPLPRETPNRPSVDAFFKSAALHWPSPGVAILLTGMGRDGAEGLLDLSRAGWPTIAQNKESCVVYGMPKAAVDLGAAGQVLPLDAIAPAAAEHLRRAAARGLGK